MQSRQIPLQQGWHFLGFLRKYLRAVLFSFVRKVAATDDARRIAADAFKDISPSTSQGVISGLKNVRSRYDELAFAPSNCARNRHVVIITARFRSGSTLLWNLFRSVEGITAYYEPFNERRWFDPLSRGNRIDETHRNVSDYWREYDGLEKLGEYYREEWTYRNLFMGANCWNPQMKRYIELLIEKARGRPVLQFNRIDFRLPWIKRHFPLAKIVHLYRNPRDQWCSSLMDLACFSKDGKMTEFGPHDKFYLLSWASDLKYHFPFLDERTVSHPYQLFYYIWKLSYLFGIKYANYSLSFEDLVEKPEITLEELFQTLELANVDLESLKSQIEKAGIGKWRQYADDSWFKQHETACESVLGEFLMPCSERAVPI